MRLKLPNNMKLASALLLAAPAALAGPPLFESPWRAFNVGDFPTFAPASMDFGDIDGDGDMDVVAGREFFGGPGMTILKNSGDGTFAPPVLYNLAYNDTIEEVALVDFDLDSDLDVLGTMSGNSGLGSSVVLWRNAGGGTFGPPVYFSTGQGPVGLAIGDFTGDGFPDAVTANFGYVAGANDTVSLLRHNGQSGLAAAFLPPLHTMVGDNIYRVVAGDIDADGDLDLAVGKYEINGVGGSGIVVLTNNGSGSFTFRAAFDAVPNAYVNSPALRFADMDNDGDIDLLSSGAQNSSQVYGMLAVRKNDGAGNFMAPAIIQLDQWTYTPHSIRTSDLNDDGWIDIIMTTPSGRANDGFNVILSNGAGGFGTAQRYEAGKQTYDAVAFDSDADGDMDVVTVANDSSVITVHKNPGSGLFMVLPRYDVGVLTNGMDAGDIDGDGDVDVVTSDTDIRILRNTGSGAAGSVFAPASMYNSPFNAGSVKLRDFNNDGMMDLLIGPNPQFPPYGFAVAISLGDGSFGPAFTAFPGGCQAGQVDAFDLDNDGDLDVVLNENTAMCGPSRIFLARNNGGGTSFTLMPPIATFQGIPFGIGGSDLDHDGNIDLVTDLAGAIGVFLGHGDFTFDLPAMMAPDTGYPFVLADMNADSNDDLVYIVPQDSFGTVSVGVMRGYGDGSFAFPNHYAAANGRESAFRISGDIDVIDADLDGKLDVVLTNNAPNDMTIFKGNGDGTLNPVYDRYGIGYSATPTSVADFTGDGKADIVSCISLPPGGFSNSVVLLKNLAATTQVPGDVTGDGTVDINDLLAVIGAWGQCPPPPAACPADANGDGAVNINDLLMVIGNWS